MKYNSLDKNAIWVMMINALILFVLILLVFAFYRNLDLDMMQEIKAAVLFIWSIIIILSFLNVVLFPKIRYERYKYLVSMEKIEVKKGLFVIKKTIIPIERVQKIELTSGPIDRVFDLSTVVIYTAAGNTTIKFLNSKEAQNLSEKVNAFLKEKIYEIK